MTRLLFWIAIIILVVMAVRSKLRAVLDATQPAPDRDHGHGAAGPTSASAGAGPVQGRVEDATERMARCAACGLHFPASEAVTVGGSEYCSTAHAHASMAP